jgi:hypothetical protein
VFPLSDLEVLRTDVLKIWDELYAGNPRPERWANVPAAATPRMRNLLILPF